MSDHRAPAGDVEHPPPGDGLLPHVELLAVELRNLVRQLDPIVDEWPPELTKLASFVLHGIDPTDTCRHCGSTDVPIGYLACTPCLARHHGTLL